MQASAEREIRQLSCLGLPGEALVPELLARLHDVAASRFNMFFWLDARGVINNAYGEDPVFYDVLPHYFAEYYGREEFELVGGTHSDFMRWPETIDDLRNMARDDRRLERSGFYNDIMQAVGLHNITYVKLREKGRPVGMVAFGTDGAKPRIDAGERERLAPLAPFVAHALAAPRSLPADGHEDEDFGVMVFDRGGALQHLSASARMLLFLATHPRAGARELRQPSAFRLEVPHKVQRLCLELGAALAGRPAAAPSHVIDNRWGRFAFRAYPLEPLRPEEGLVGMIVQRQIPTALALWRRIRALGLPARQAEVCFHLANGGAYTAIAKAMNVSINTITWHVREIYARFDVHGAGELRAKLLAG